MLPGLTASSSHQQLPREVTNSALGSREEALGETRINLGNKPPAGLKQHQNEESSNKVCALLTFFP